MLPSEPKQQISKSIYFIGKRIKHKSPDSKNKCWMSDLVISRPTEHSTHTQVNLCIIYFYEAFIYVHNMCCVMSSFFSFGTLLHFPVNIELACGCGGICKACVYFTFASQCVCHVAYTCSSANTGPRVRDPPIKTPTHSSTSGQYL